MDHLATCFLPLPLSGLLLQHVQHLVARGAVLEGELADDLAEVVDVHLLGLVQRQTHEQQQFLVPGGIGGGGGGGRE